MKFRIVENKDGKFEAHSKRMFWPFWFSISYSVSRMTGKISGPFEYHNSDDAGEAIEDYIADKKRKRKIIEYKPTNKGD